MDNGVLVLSKKRDFVREMEKWKCVYDSKMNEVSEYWRWKSKNMMGWWCVVMVLLFKKRDFVRELEKYGNVYVAATLWNFKIIESERNG